MIFKNQQWRNETRRRIKTNSLSSKKLEKKKKIKRKTTWKKNKKEID